MTATQKAKQQIRDLQETLQLIEEAEDECNRLEESIEVDELTGTESSESLLTNLEESRELLRAYIDRWNEIINSSTIQAY
jgi:chaperonin cofactor prefoldin